jgi:LmbE family N-acetylglucosaminyl deacetylase
MPIMTPSGIMKLLTPHRLVMVLALAMAGVFACSSPPAIVPPAQPAQVQARPTVMQVVAHEDDDLLFMNPDLMSSIHSGTPIVTVFLTAGESDVPDAAGYAASRQAGSRAAYAHLAGVVDEWRSESLAVGAGRVELYTLTARPDLRLIFVNLPDNNDPRADGGKKALTRLWRDGGDRLRIQTLVPAGGVVREPVGYRRGDVVALLVGLFQRYRPTVVRTQDAQPDQRYTAAWLPFHDHPDHVMAARFTGEAVRAYRAGGANPRLVQTNYRDYNVEEAPVNLSAADQQAKIDLFGVYARHDPQVFAGGSYDAWPRRMYHRWPLGTGWAALDSGGRAQVFLVQAGELLTWWQTPDGWAGPASLGDAGGMLAASVSVVRGGDGRLRVFARRLDEDQIVTITQSSPGDPRGWPATWESLGNPNLNDGPAAQTEFGPPVAVAAGDRIVVFVRTAAGGVSSRTSTGDTWQPGWAKLGGTDVQDGLAAVSDPAGKIDLYAVTRDRVLRWSQAQPSDQLVLNDGFPGGVPAGPPVVAGSRVFYKQAGTAEVTSVPGATGAGGLAALADGPDVLLWARNPAGAVIMATAGRGGWTDLGGAGIVDTPVALRDGSGGILLLGEGGDGRLMVNQRRAGSPGFGGWQLAG